MARAIWSGSIAFGLVSLPVQLHTAVRDHRPRFRLLCAADHSPIRLERVCIRDGRPVAWENLVKGFEYEKGRFVTLTKDDLRAAAVDRRRRLEIVTFVKGDEVDDRYFDTPYYVTPGKGGERTYAVLREALRKTGRIGVGQIVLRESQHLAALEPIDQALVLTLLRYDDELMDVTELNLPDAQGMRKDELDLAITLVERFSRPWKPAEYKDDFQSKLMSAIRARLKGRLRKPVAPPEPETAKVIDLMERLRRSLASRPRRAPARTARKKRSTKHAA